MHFSFENDVVSFKFLVNFTEVGKKSPCSYLFTSSLSRNSCKVNLPPYSSVSSEKFVRFVPVQTDLDKYGLVALLNEKIKSCVSLRTTVGSVLGRVIHVIL